MAKLRCKPGDLAVITRALLPENIGVFCTVLGASGIPDYEWSIRFQSPRRAVLSGDNTIDAPGLVGIHPDAWLQPIRDPGEEAVDETLLWNPIKEEA